jgi:hypothetical protein
MPEKWERDLEEIARGLKAKTDSSGTPAARSPLPFPPRRPSSHFFSPTRLNIFLAVILLVLVLLILKQLQVGPFGTITSMFTSLFNPTYTAQVPGPGCDHGAKANMWGTGNMHHERGVDMNDPYTALKCESYGLLITRTGDHDVYGDVFFGNPADQPLSNNYRVQITAQVIQGDSNVTVNLSVHGQSKYGADNIAIGSDGLWQITPHDDTTGQAETRLASGMLAQHSSIFTIMAEVHGPNITATINGEQVATVSDPNYSSTSFLGFGVADPAAIINPSALFSNFVYTPL